MPSEFQLKSFCWGLFTLFSTLSWIDAFLFRPYLSSFCLIIPRGFKHNPAAWVLLCEVWQWGLVAEAGCMDWNVKLYIQPAAVGYGEDLKSLHPYTVCCTQELPSFCWAGMKVLNLWGRKKNCLNLLVPNCTHTVATLIRKKEEQWQKTKRKATTAAHNLGF